MATMIGMSFRLDGYTCSGSAVGTLAIGAAPFSSSTMAEPGRSSLAAILLSFREFNEIEIEMRLCERGKEGNESAWQSLMLYCNSYYRVQERE